MKLKMYLRMLLAAVAALFVATACGDSDEETNNGGGGGGTTEPVTLQIAVSDIEGSNAKLNVTSSDQLATYYWNAVKKSIYDGLGSDKAFLDDDLAFIQQDATNEKMTLSAYLQWKTGRGTATYTVTGLEANTEYYAYVYGINYDGTVTTDLVKELFTSDDGTGGGGEEGDGPEFTIFEVDPGDQNGNSPDTKMTVWIATKDVITSGSICVGTTESISSLVAQGKSYEQIINENGQPLDAEAIEIINDCVGREGYALALTLPGFEPGNYTVICMVSDDGGDTVDHTDVTLAAPGDGPELTLQIAAGDNDGANTDTKMTVGMKAPGTTSGKYGLFLKSEIDGLLAKDYTYETIIKTDGVGKAMTAQYVGYVAGNGLALTFEGLTPGTAYTAIVLVSNAKGDTVKALSASTTGGEGPGEGPELTLTAEPGDADGLNTDTKMYWAAYAPTAQSAIYGTFETAGVQTNLDKGFTHDEIVTQLGKAMTAEWMNYLTTDPGIGVTSSGLTPNTSYTVIVKVTDAAGKSTVKYATTTTTEPVEPTTVELKNLAKGDMDYWGDAYTLPTNNYANWNIYLYDATIDLDEGKGTGDAIMLELNTAKNVTTEITPGTYNVMANRYAAEFVPFSCVPGYTITQDGKTFAAGTWYIKELTYENMLTSGSVVVSKSGDNYTFTFELLDQTTNTTVKGTYTGPMTYTDKTKKSAPALLTPMRGFKNGYAKSVDASFESYLVPLTSLARIEAPAQYKTMTVNAPQILSVATFESKISTASFLKVQIGEKTKYRKARNE